jgi:hypothetical protein
MKKSRLLSLLFGMKPRQEYQCFSRSCGMAGASQAEPWIGRNILNQDLNPLADSVRSSAIMSGTNEKLAENLCPDAIQRQASGRAGGLPLD